MAHAAEIATPIAWWREPSREQWHAWIAAWLGWVLDAFDFTIFLLIMAPIAKDFDVPLGEARLGHIGLDEWLRRSKTGA
jgi:hypothetical protein